jgi:hypothetical protein
LKPYQRSLPPLAASTNPLLPPRTGHHKDLLDDSWDPPALSLAGGTRTCWGRDVSKTPAAVYWKEKPAANRARIVAPSSRFPPPPPPPPPARESNPTPRPRLPSLHHGRRVLQRPPLPAAARLLPPPRAPAQGPLRPPPGAHPRLCPPSPRPPRCAQAPDASSLRRPGSAFSPRRQGAAAAAFGCCDAAASTTPADFFFCCGVAASGSASGAKGAAAEGHSAGESIKFLFADCIY